MTKSQIKNIISEIVTKLFRHGEIVTEGINDKSILKAFFMAGGPGSGKSRVVADLFGFPSKSSQTISYRTGLKLINSDIAFEAELKKMGVDPKSLSTISSDEFDKLTNKIDSPRQKAKDITSKRAALYENGKLGMIIDGTGKSLNTIVSKKEKLEMKGYDTFMIFVNTSLEVALERNARRSRSLPDEMVKKSWKDVQDNLGSFQREFGNSNMFIIDNSKEGVLPIQDIEKQIMKILPAPIKNPIGKAWIKKHSS